MAVFENQPGVAAAGQGSRGAGPGAVERVQVEAVEDGLGPGDVVGELVDAAHSRVFDGRVEPAVRRGRDEQGVGRAARPLTLLLMVALGRP